MVTYPISGPWGSGKVARCHHCGGRPEAIPAGIIPAHPDYIAQCSRCHRELYAEDDNHDR